MASNSTETTLEEARRCPSCENPGVLVNTRRARSQDVMPGARVELYECRNDARCPEFMPTQTAGTSVMPASRNRWAIQINPDGTIPPKNIGMTQTKAFGAINEHGDLAQRARDQLRFMAAQDEDPSGKGTYEIGQDIGYR